MKSIIRFLATALCGGLITAVFMHKPYTTASRAIVPPVDHTINHLGFIMDGNRRWAKERGLDPWLGHRQGVQTVRMVIDFCCEQNINELSLYVWSLENFKRSLNEQEYLFSTLASELAAMIESELIEKGVRIRIVGNKEQFPEKLRQTIAHAETRTAQGDRLTLNLLFCYGGQQEIVAATKKIARAAHAGDFDLETLTPASFSEMLWSGEVSDPDIIIRTGKRKSLSNFYTFKSAYSEIYFLDCYWPDLTRDHIINAITAFGATERKYGA
jgi:undecaprenyl diphosphate synthase